MRRLMRLFRRNKLESQLDSELRFHIEQRTGELMAAGAGPAEARRQAMIEFGGVERAKEECREARGWALLDTLRQDLRFGLRQIGRSPGFATVVILSLALGIGANTAIFSLVDAVMLRALPVKHPHELVLLNWISQQQPAAMKMHTGYESGGPHGASSTSFSYPCFEQMRAQNRVLSSLVGFVSIGVTEVGIRGEAHLENGELVTGDYFSGLGVSPILGRPIADEDEQPGAAHAAVISYGFWSREFGRSPSALDQAITVDGVPFTIVGVAPPEFFGVQPGRAVDVWVPFVESAKLLPYGMNSPPSGLSMFGSRGWWWLMMMGRLKPGVTRQQANARLDVLFHQSVLAGVATPPKPELIPHMDLESGARGLDMLREQFSEPLGILMIVVGVVLLVACANVATLLVARSESRRKEIALRLSLGAPRRRVVRQLLTESVLLAGLGGALGLWLAWWGSRALLALVFSGGSSPGGGPALGLSVALDGRVLGFTAAVSILTGILFGIAPALRSTDMTLTSELKEASGASFAGRRTRLRLGNFLVVSQVALSLLLLVGAGLFLRTLVNLEDQNLGFNQHHLLLFAMDPTTHGYQGPRLIDLYSRLLARFQALPGVKAATASEMALITGWENDDDVSIEGRKPKPGQSMGAEFNGVGPSFLQTMEIPLKLGRGIDWTDTAGSPKVAVVNEAFVRDFLSGADPLGQDFVFKDFGNPHEPYRIVGLAGDAKYDRLDVGVRPTVYLPWSQLPFPLGGMHFELRAAGNPLALVSAVRAAVHEVDPTLPVAEFQTQTEQIAETLMQQRLFARLSSFFGALTILLACIGLFGLMAFAVTRRSHEIGIRMALGAQRGDVLRMVIRQGLLLIGAGIVVGVGGAFALTRLLRSFLFEVKPADPVTFATAAAVLATAALAACYVPARRAARVDPVVALRQE